MDAPDLSINTRLSRVADCTGLLRGRMTHNVTHRRDGIQMNRGRAAALFSLSVVLLLAGCSSSGVSYSVLDRAAEASDALPAAVVDGVDEIDIESARFIGARDGTSLWLAKAERTDTVCLVVYPNDEDWVVGCGAEGAELGVGGPSGDYALVPDGMPAREGATKITENVYLVDG